MHIFRKTINNNIASFYLLVKLSDLHLLEASLHALLDLLCYPGVGIASFPLGFLRGYPQLLLGIILLLILPPACSLSHAL
jgi:hypothetical protein